MFALFVPGLLSSVAYFKTLAMTLLFASGFALVFLTGEVVATANHAWRLTLINSYWYKCSLRTQQAMTLLFLTTQTDIYLSVKGLIPCNFLTMVKIVKTAYSMFNVMRFERIKNN
uniref:Uncharacterized protein n=1 Tax=Cacopsylla melanoneura TaxID=428564 RepID=A0A8D9BBQ8_9HEMI